jgi:hypothetical protein
MLFLLMKTQSQFMVNHIQSNPRLCSALISTTQTGKKNRTGPQTTLVSLGEIPTLMLLSNFIMYLTSMLV